MPTIRTRDGRTLTWTGHNICFCAQCEQLFNSVAAVDALDAAKDALERHAEEGIQEVQLILEEAD